MIGCFRLKLAQAAMFQVSEPVGAEQGYMSWCTQKYPELKLRHPCSLPFLDSLPQVTVSPAAALNEEVKGLY